MGQKIDYDPADWDDEFQTPSVEDSSLDENSVDENKDTFADSVSGFDAEEAINESTEISDSLADNRLALLDSETLAVISPEDKKLFNRQLEDLFELLELEDQADKNAGMKIYQTDSSPSKPWRFH